METLFKGNRTDNSPASAQVASHTLLNGINGTDNHHSSPSSLYTNIEASLNHIIHGHYEKIPSHIAGQDGALNLDDVVEKFILHDTTDLSNAVKVPHVVEQAREALGNSAGETENLDKVNKTMDAMDVAEQNISTKVAYFATRELPDITLYLAKSDHITWKKRLANMLIGRETLDPDELSSHRTCRLGKWYYALAQDDEYAQHPAFKALEEPHEAVHKYGI